MLNSTTVVERIRVMIRIENGFEAVSRLENSTLIPHVAADNTISVSQVYDVFALKAVNTDEVFVLV